MNMLIVQGWTESKKKKRKKKGSRWNVDAEFWVVNKKIWRGMDSSNIHVIFFPSPHSLTRRYDWGCLHSSCCNSGLLHSDFPRTLHPPPVLVKCDYPIVFLGLFLDLSCLDPWRGQTALLKSMVVSKHPPFALSMLNSTISWSLHQDCLWPLHSHQHHLVDKKEVQHSLFPQLLYHLEKEVIIVLYGTCLPAGWTWWSLEVPFDLCDSVVLWFCNTL